MVLPQPRRPKLAVKSPSDPAGAGSPPPSARRSSSAPSRTSSAAASTSSNRAFALVLGCVQEPAPIPLRLRGSRYLVAEGSPFRRRSSGGQQQQAVVS